VEAYFLARTWLNQAAPTSERSEQNDVAARRLFQIEHLHGLLGSLGDSIATAREETDKLGGGVMSLVTAEFVVRRSYRDFGRETITDLDEIIELPKTVICA